MADNHKWFQVTGSATVAARTEDEAYEYVLANYTMLGFLNDDVEDVTEDSGDQDFLDELDEEGV